MNTSPAAPMTPFEKALVWHTLGKAWSPNAPSVHHVDAILAELARAKSDRPQPDPALVARVRSALDFGAQHRALAVPIDLTDLEQLLAVVDIGAPTPTGEAR